MAYMSSCTLPEMAQKIVDGGMISKLSLMASKPAYKL
jgi:hypothetical protein